jgi:hypothetical protein
MDEFSTDPAMTDAETVTGEDQKLPLIPGISIYFRRMASDTSFMSGIQELTVPSRPEAPDFGIDFVNETTTEGAGPDIHFSEFPDMKDSNAGVGEPIELKPGTDFYLRYAASSEAFTSEIQHLVVPERPVLAGPETDTVYQTPIQFSVEFPGTATGLTTEGISVENGTVIHMAENLVFQVEPGSEGTITVKVLPDAIDEHNFESIPFIVWYSLETGITTRSATEDLKLYPNPVSRYLHINLPGKESHGSVCDILDNEGRVVRRFEIVSFPSGELNITDLATGIYFVRIKTGNHFYTGRFLKVDE